MGDHLLMGRLMSGALAGALPIAQSHVVTSRLGVVMRHYLGLRLHHFGKSGLQHLCHLLVHPLPRALEQRGIRSILHQSVFEAIRGLRQRTALVAQISGNQLLESGL